MDEIESPQSSLSDTEFRIEALSEDELSQVTGGFYNPFGSSGQKTLTGAVKQADGSFNTGTVTVSKQLYKQAEAEKAANGGKSGPIYKTIFSDLNPK